MMMVPVLCVEIILLVFPLVGALVWPSLWLFSQKIPSVHRTQLPTLRPQLRDTIPLSLVSNGGSNSFSSTPDSFWISLFPLFSGSPTSASQRVSNSASADVSFSVEEKTLKSSRVIAERGVSHSVVGYMDHDPQAAAVLAYKSKAKSSLLQTTQKWFHM